MEGVALRPRRRLEAESFNVVSRLSDINDILTGLEVVYAGVEDGSSRSIRRRPSRPAASSPTWAFVEDLLLREELRAALRAGAGRRSRHRGAGARDRDRRPGLAGRGRARSDDRAVGGGTLAHHRAAAVAGPPRARPGRRRLRRSRGRRPPTSGRPPAEAQRALVLGEPGERAEARRAGSRARSSGVLGRRASGLAAAARAAAEDPVSARDRPSHAWTADSRRGLERATAAAAPGHRGGARVAPRPRVPQADPLHAAGRRRDARPAGPRGGRLTAVPAAAAVAPTSSTPTRPACARPSTRCPPRVRGLRRQPRGRRCARPRLLRSARGRLRGAAVAGRGRR